jgi:hypothetical protein
MVLQSNIELPTVGIRLQVSNTHLFIENIDYGKGTLCVAERYKAVNFYYFCFLVLKTFL